MSTAPQARKSRHIARPESYDRFRGSSGQRGYNAKWANYSRAYRNDHPRCVKCGRSSECVDHIQPVQGTSDPLFWDDANHQALCTTCHSKKTAKEDGGFGNRRAGRAKSGGR